MLPLMRITKKGPTYSFSLKWWLWVCCYRHLYEAYEHNTCTRAEVIIKIIRSIWGGGSMMVFIINISNLLSPTAFFLPISKLRLSKMLMTSKETQEHEKEYQQKRVLLRPQRENKEVNIQEIEPWKIKDYMLSHC